MNKDLSELTIPEYDLEKFMISITYQPEGMSMSLGRQAVTKKRENLSAPMREMKMLRKGLELLPIGINEDDLLAGNYGKKFADEQYLKAAKKADEEEFGQSVEYKFRSEDEHIASGRYMLFGIYTPSHTTVDYPMILKKGLKDYEKRINKKLLETSEDAYAYTYLTAMKESIRTVEIFEKRYIELLDPMIKDCQDEKRRHELTRMRNALCRVPYEPAADLYEALQSMWMIHTMSPASERCWASVSLGRMDVYLLEYYQKWLKDGHSKEEAIELFAAFFVLLDSYGDGSGTLNLGPDWNELSELLLEVEKKAGLRAPIIAVRMAKDTPERIYDTLIDPKLFKIGQPTFYGEESCVEAMKYRGISGLEGYAVNSCMGQVVVGKEIADMWGCCVNMSLPLELALNHGQPIYGELPASVQKYLTGIPLRDPDTMDAVRRSYADYLRGLVSYVADQNLNKSAWIAMNRPNPFLSLLTEDCISYGRDRAHSAVNVLGAAAEAHWNESTYDFQEMRNGRGAHYHNVTVLAMGFAHAADALTAIEKLVFTEKKYTVNDFLEAAASNYSGNRRTEELYADLMHCELYATGSEKADGNAAFVLNCLADGCEENYRGNVRFVPTCHTIDSNVQFGACVYAGLDGRHNGEPFGKNAGAVMWAIKNTPTDLMLGESRLPNTRFSGGMPIDIYVPDNIINNAENRIKFRNLLQAYFEMGGMQVQVNSVDLELLKKAYEDPVAYSKVIVRKGGFSIYFTDMFREVQKDMIDRLGMELKG